VRRLPTFLIASAALLLAAPASALASQLIDKNTSHVSIAVDSSHHAVVSYVRGGVGYHVIMWGAINAFQPSKAHKQVKFKLDYSGGSASFGAGYWKKIVKNNVCGPYTGPALHWLVVACTTPRGQNWALQAWQKLLVIGYKRTTPSERAWELHASHWTGPLPVLWLKADWIYSGRYDHLYGKYSYRGVAVHGFGASHTGNPTDSYGRNIYVDTLNPPWPTGYVQAGGWRRFNAFLAHNPRGNFCAGVFKNLFGPSPAGAGQAYRATAMGPGVTPVVFWQGDPPGTVGPGGFPLRPDGLPNYNTLPNPPVENWRYTKEHDKAYEPEEQAISGRGDSCYANAGR
jgi:hypothetical protein